MITFTAVLVYSMAPAPLLKEQRRGENPQPAKTTLPHLPLPFGVVAPSALTSTSKFMRPGFLSRECQMVQLAQSWRVCKPSHLLTFVGRRRLSYRRLSYRRIASGNLLPHVKIYLK